MGRKVLPALRACHAGGRRTNVGTQPAAASAARARRSESTGGVAGGAELVPSPTMNGSSVTGSRRRGISVTVIDVMALCLIRRRPPGDIPGAVDQLPAALEQLAKDGPI